MKVDKLYIRSRFKNLENVCIDFDEDNLMTVVVGRNGTGKSNVLEALVSIFRNLDLGESPLFSYQIRYKLGEGASTRWIEVDADPNRGTLTKQYLVHVSQKKPTGGFFAEQESNSLQGHVEQISLSKIKRDTKTGTTDYLPNYLFAYYSGPSDRLEKYFKKHRTDFYKKLLRNKVNLSGDIRPLFYAKPAHSQFVLLAFFLSEQNSEMKKFLREELGIEGLDSVHFVMRKPDWAKEKDELFWGAYGVVRKFLDKLFPHTLSPIRTNRPEETTLTGTGLNNDFFHLYLPEAQTLRNFAKDLSEDEFFKMLESTLLSEIISEVNVRVKVSSSSEPLTFRELSEGEQQLLTVLGLLRFTGGKDSLFLLDEPDTHLNPAWTVKYLSFLRQFIPNQQTSHVLMVTHHPLAIAELEKGQVQVLTCEDDYHVIARAPEESPRGMGINMILRSEMFGLKTTLDKITNDKVISRNFLASQETLTVPETKKLEKLNMELDDLGFSISHDDPDYMDFLREKYHHISGDKK